MIGNFSHKTTEIKGHLLGMREVRNGNGRRSEFDVKLRNLCHLLHASIYKVVVRIKSNLCKDKSKESHTAP
jgi:hypothetical protein